MASLVDISNRAADAAGIPRILLLACAIAESNMNPRARRPGNASNDERYWPDVSMGAWQQTVRWAAEYRGDGRYPGASDVERIGNLYYDPEYAARVAASSLATKYRPDEPDAILRALARYNWPGGGGEPANAAVEQNYRRGIRDATALLGAPAPPSTPLAYNPDIPAELQRQDWTCSVRTAMWVLKSLGVAITPEDAQDDMVAHLEVNPTVGLTDARGYGLAAMLRRHLPAEWADRVQVFESISYDELRSLDGAGPIALGGRAWGHWTAVRRANEDGTLALANPAPTWQGVGDTMDRAEWDRWGPFSAVWVNAQAAAPAPPPPPTDPRDTRIAELEAALAEANRALAEERSKLGVASVDYANGLQDLTNAYRALRPGG